MSVNQKIKEVVSILTNASNSKEACSPIREIIGLEDLETAYKIQEKITRSRVRKGGRIVGKKIGLTSLAVQNQLGVDQPDFGTLFNDMEVDNGGIVPWNELMQPKAEAEIAFVLGKDLDGSQLGAVDIISAIDYALVSIEIVGSRIEKWNIKITDTIADNASASHFVLGHKPTKLKDLDLTNCAMKMYKNGKEVAKGKGSDCLGSPINATLWLAKKMAALKQPLKKGDIILSGALGAMCPVKPGDEVKAEIEGLGSVSVIFGEEGK